LANHALAIDRAAGLPIMLYNYPGRTGTMMDVEFLDRVGRSTNFCAIKDSSGSIDHLHALARDYPHIDLFCGMHDQALEFFGCAAPATVCLRNISRFSRRAWLKRTSRRGARSCRLCSR